MDWYVYDIQLREAVDGPYDERADAIDAQMDLCAEYVEADKEHTRLTKRPEWRAVEDPTGHYTFYHVDHDERLFYAEHDDKFEVGVYDADYYVVGDVFVTESEDRALAELVRRALDAF